MAIAAFWMTVATWVHVGIAVIGTIVAIVGAILVLRSLRYSRDATKAATTAAEEATEANTLNRITFIADQRPWLSFERINAVSALKWNTNEGKMKCEIRIKNFGRTPAQDVRIAADMSPNIGNEWPTAFYVRVVRQTALETWATVVFPATEARRTFEITIRRADLAINDCGVQFAVVPVFAACVSYGTIYSTERFQTGVLYNVIRIVDGSLDLIRTDQGDIPAEQLYFTESPLQGIVAT